MDWKRFIWGKEPETLFEYQRALKNTRLMTWILIGVLIIIFFGGLQQKSEVNDCWDQLEDYRMADSIIAGVPVSSCHIRDGLLICTDDLRSIT